MAHEVKLEVFQGPIDLLLHLRERSGRFDHLIGLVLDPAGR